MWLYQQWRSGKREPLERALKEAYKEPANFWRELWGLQDTILGLPCRSLLHSSYDLYYDCVERHLGRGDIAFRDITMQGVEEYTFEDIHGYVCCQQRRWQRSWMGEGAHVCIVMPVGIEFVVSLMMVFRLGLSFTYLPTDSPSLTGGSVTVKLEELNPTVTLSVPGVASLVGSHHPLLLIERLEADAEITVLAGASYPRHRVLQRSLNTFSRNHGAWGLLTAEETYLYALRDGLLPLGLRPALSWCYPLGCSLKEQPSHLIAAMLCGATTVVAAEGCLQGRPELLCEHAIDILGIAPRLRRLWLEGSHSIPRGLKFWYRHLYDTATQWRHFAKSHRLHHLTSSAIHVSNGDGGVVLFTFPAVEDDDTKACWPAAGSSWTVEPADIATAAAISYGIFTLQHTHKREDAVLILAKAEEQWHVAGSAVPHRYGETIPLLAIEEAAESLPFAEQALLLPLQDSEVAWAYCYTLLIFVSPLSRDLLAERQVLWRKDVRRVIAEQQGAAFLPEEIVFYALSPKLSVGKKERGDILFNYITKILDSKKNQEIYNALHSLRHFLKKN